MKWLVFALTVVAIVAAATVAEEEEVNAETARKGTQQVLSDINDHDSKDEDKHNSNLKPSRVVKRRRIIKFRTPLRRVRTAIRRTIIRRTIRKAMRTRIRRAIKKARTRIRRVFRTRLTTRRYSR